MNNLPAGITLIRPMLQQEPGAPVRAAARLCGQDPDRLGSLSRGDQCRAGLLVDPGRLQVRVVQGYIRRVSQNQVEGSFRPGAMPVTLHKPNVLQPQPQGIALSQLDRGTRMIQGQDPAVGPGSGECQGECTAAGAPLEDARPARQPAQRLFDEQFGFGAGRQDLGSQPD